MNNIKVYKIVVGGFNGEVQMIDSVVEIPEEEIGFEVDGVMVGAGTEDYYFVVSRDDIDANKIEGGDELDEYWERMDEIDAEYFE